MVNMEWDSFWAINKASYEPTALRLMAIEAAGCVELEVTNVPQYDDGGIHALITQQHPKDESMGMRPIACRGSFVGGRRRRDHQRRRGNCSGAVGPLQDHAEGRQAHSRVLQEGADRSTFKKKKAIHWLAASPVQVATDIVEGQCGHSQYGDVVPCTLIEYDYLLAKNKLDEGDELVHDPV